MQNIPENPEKPAGQIVVAEGITGLEVFQTQGGTMGVREKPAFEAKTVAAVNPDNVTEKTGEVVIHKGMAAGVIMPQ